MRLITLFLVFMLCSPTFSHFPQNTTFKVFQFPDSHVPLMDGDAADWSMVPDEYFYDSSHPRGMVFEYSIDSTGTKTRVLVPDTLAIPAPTSDGTRRKTASILLPRSTMTYGAFKKASSTRSTPTTAA